MHSILKHCPRCGSSSFASADHRLYHCPACDLHFFPNTASAVGVFLLDPDRNLLLLKRARDPAKGKLALAGGFIDPGESVEQALRREVREEVGLEVAHPRFLTSAPNRYTYRDVTYDVLDLFFTAEVPDLRKADARDEVDGLVILPLEKVDPDSLAFPSLRVALAALRTNSPFF